MGRSDIDTEISRPATGGRPGRIILVEDDNDLRDGTAEYLTRVGYDVTAVDSGLRFYHALAEASYDVALIDLGLPDMDGLQLVEYIRNNTAMRCIILTARDSVDDRVYGYDSGADLYLVKPVDCRELASALSRMIQRCTAGGHARAASDSWRLSRQNAILSNPSAVTVTLTVREMDFLISLTPGETIPRTTILESMGYANDELSNRALESLIRRLRRKIERVCGSSPILTRHGVGYAFGARLILH